MKQKLLFLLLLLSTLFVKAQELVATFEVNQESCSQFGSINILASGGDGNYVYAVTAEGNIVSNAEFSPNSFFELQEGTYDCYVRDNNGTINYNEYFETVNITRTAFPDFNHTEEHPTCPGDFGSVTVEITQGTPPYLIEVTGLPPVTTTNIVTVFTNIPETSSGSVTVTDVYDCSFSHSLLILAPDPIISSAYISQEYTTCPTITTAEITFTPATGGTPPYSYGINGVYSENLIKSNLTDGTYELTVRDSNDCEVLLPNIVIEPLSTQPDFYAEVVYNCEGNADTVSVFPVNSSYTYTLNTKSNNTGVFENVSAGTHVINVDYNDSCSAELIAIVESGSELRGEILEVNNSQCSGSNNGSVTIEAFNFDEFVDQYQVSADGGLSWSTTSDNPYVFEGLEAGSHEIRIRQIEDLGNPDDSSSTIITNCDVLVGTITIEEPEQLAVNTTITKISCSGEDNGEISVEATGGTPPYEFSIDNGATWQSSNVFSGLSAGEHQINIRDSRFCTECGCTTNPFENGSFEDATFVPVNFFSITDEENIAGWETTAPDNKLEVWGTNFQNGRPAYSGNYFVELNANSSAIDQALFQEFCTKEGDVFQWQVAHRGRTGIDVAQIRIGGSIATAVRQDVTDIGGDVTQTMTTGTTGGDDPINRPGWKLYTGTYVVPPGQSSTVILFEAVSSSIGNLSVGNFLDAIRIDIIGSTCNSTTVIIEEAAPLISEISVTSNSISIESSGGIPPYEYSIDGGITYQTSPVFNNLEDGNYEVITRDINGCNILEQVIIEEFSITALDDLETTNQDNPIVINIFDNDINIPTEGSITTTDPNNGVVTVNDSGTPNDLTDDSLTYTPNTGFSGTDTFTYTVCDVTFNYCDTAIVTINVGETAQEFTLETVVEAGVSCFGTNDGIIQTLVSGSQSPYRYQIIDAVVGGEPIFNVVSNENIFTFTDLAAGDYLVKVIDAFDNEITQTIVLDALPEIVGTLTLENPTCNGESDGSIIVDNVSGGSGNYSYSINVNPNQFQVSPIFSGLSSGSYEVTILDDNGCNFTIPATIDEPTPVIIDSIVAIPTGNEASGNIVVGATGGNGNYSFSIDEINFSFSDSFFDLQAGIYNIIASDSNACLSAPVEVTVISLDIDNSVAEDILGVLSANFSDAIAYQWINIDTGERIPGATSAFFTPTENGRYQVEMTIADATTISAKGIKTVTANQKVLSPVIVFENAVLSTTDFEKNFKVYPNPANDFITLPNTLIDQEFEIYNTLGQEVLKGKVNSTTLELTNLAVGMYYLKVSSHNVVQFIKE